MNSAPLHTVCCLIESGCRLLTRGQEVADLILCGNAHVFICGDGNRMAKDVQRVLVEILRAHGDMTGQCAEAFLNEMRSRRRLLMDVWS